MNARRCAVFGVWLGLQAVLAQAQTADADALERARRDADNPMRLIIEAGKIKSKAKTDADAKADAKSEDKPVAERPTARAAVKPPAEPVHVSSPEETRAAALASVRGLPPAGAAGASASQAAPSTPSAPASASVADAPSALAEASPPAPAADATQATTSTPTREPAGTTDRAADPSTTLPAPTAASSSSPAAAPAAGAAPAAVAADTAPTPSAGAQTASASALPTVSAGAPPAPPSVPVAAPPESRRVASVAVPVAPSATPAALELLNMVQPELPERLRKRLRRDGEVILVFKVNTDGSVVDLNVQSSNDPTLDEIAVDAVRQWRYKPIPEARTHRVQIVFRRE